MFTEPVLDALRTLSSALATSPPIARSLYANWRTGLFVSDDTLGMKVHRAADIIEQELPTWSREHSNDPELGRLFHDPLGEIVFIWCAASVGRSDIELAPLIAAALKHEEYNAQALIVARQRIVQGPLEDALRCVPLLGRGDVLTRKENREAASRLEILLWEAGACALQVPYLGAWIWESAETFDEVIGRPARGALRGRVLAARCLEIAACGIPAMTDPQLVGRTLQVLQPLLLHPEPLVWTHAARSFGRFAKTFEPLEGTLLDWVHAGTPVLRQRAITAFASLPAERLRFLAHELITILDSTEEEPWVLAAAAAATPYLYHERRDLWDRMARRILSGAGGPIAARSLGRGLRTLWRQRKDRAALEPTFRRLRDMARRARTHSIDEWRRWIELIAITDPLDEAERDPLDVELGLENLVRVAAKYDDEEADARAARFAGTLAPTFAEAKRIALGEGSLRHRAAALNAFEGCARSLALRLWGPLLATHPEGETIEEPDLEEAWQLIAHTPAEILDLVKSRRESGESDARFDLTLEILALRIGGYALDASGDDDLGPGRGPTAHETCLWLRKLDGLADGSREMPPSLQSALSAIFWRLVDTTRGTALGEVDDVAWLGPFAAWWALVIDRPAILQQLATALPMIADGVLDHCCTVADTTRAALTAGALDGQWHTAAIEGLTALRADDTELAAALTGFASALANFSKVSGTRPGLDEECMSLVLATERVRRSLSDPVRALHPPAAHDDDSLDAAATENAPRTAKVLARAIRARDLSLLDVWFASIGPIASALAEAAVQGAVTRTPPPPPEIPQKKTQPKTLVGYDLVKALGEGGIGSVWLVRKPGADRLFVLKIPKADVLQSATETERAGILASFTDEARALAGLYHPNVANIIDRGVADGVPYLVLEYLIGADLKQYSSARKMTLFELRKVVRETCAGLAALHSAGLVHRDIKPANLWLRLPLAGGERFDPEKHRDPAAAQPLSTVIIDFGMVRAMRVPPDVGGRFVAGTPGYIAPEQVLDPVELDGRADVYALAGTVYNVTTGRLFFDEIENPRDRILAHMKRDPMENLEPFRVFPAELIKLMHAATSLDWRDRPTPIEFGRAFEQAI